MTALVSFYTDEGFVFGADGRSSGGGVVERDDVQKIYGCRSVNVRALLGWSGYAALGGLQGDFSLQLIALSVIEGCEKETFRDIADYGAEIATSIRERIQKYLTHSSTKLDASLKEVANLAFVGYVNAKPQSVQIRLSADSGFLDEPLVLNSHNPPAPCLNITSGYLSVYESMVSRDEMHPCSTLAEGSVLIQKYIRACAIEQTGGANPIGGHIHVAAITPSDSQWLVPPKP